MAASVRDKSVGPDEGWRFYRDDIGLVKSPSYNTLIVAVKLRCFTNGRPSPTVAEIEQYLCDNVTVRCTAANGKLYENRYANKRNWPHFLLFMKAKAQPGDLGLGDILAREIGPIGSEAQKEWSRKTLGGCGCHERQQDFNSEYPI